MHLLKIKRKGEQKKTLAQNHDDEKIEPKAKDQLGVSHLASLRILELTKDKNLKQYLRIAIRGGGCSGLTIHYEIVSEIRNNDVIFNRDNAEIIIDTKSLSILGGSTLHCRDYLGSKEFFLVNNPAEKQCSCGQSFAF